MFVRICACPRWSWSSSRSCMDVCTLFNTRSWPPGRIYYTASELKFLSLHPMAFKTSCHSVLNEWDDVWTSVYCLEQDLGHQAGLNKSCSRRLGRNNSNRHMHWWLRLYKKKSFQTVLDDLEPCMGIVDGIAMVLEYVWRSLHCLNKILATRPD